MLPLLVDLPVILRDFMELTFSSAQRLDVLLDDLIRRLREGSGSKAKKQDRERKPFVFGIFSSSEDRFEL